MWSTSRSGFERLSADNEVGNLSINHLVTSIAETPFGGVKAGGCGREVAGEPSSSS
jgi:acyl-CoA reductase-like NAD-dependent aldehyde dehydrogenase